LEDIFSEVLPPPSQGQAIQAFQFVARENEHGDAILNYLRRLRHNTVLAVIAGRSRPEDGVASAGLWPGNPDARVKPAHADFVCIAVGPKMTRYPTSRTNPPCAAVRRS
jgi:hypothetical protein